jgi:hypothetical protein
MHERSLFYHCVEKRQNHHIPQTKKRCFVMGQSPSNYPATLTKHLEIVLLNILQSGLGLLALLKSQKYFIRQQLSAINRLIRMIYGIYDAFEY